MGALGELLKSSNQIEVRRAATTIISRHKLDLRPSHAHPPIHTDPTSDSHKERDQHPAARRDRADWLKISDQRFDINRHRHSLSINAASLFSPRWILTFTKGSDWPVRSAASAMEWPSIFTSRITWA